jgi:hypothetical protein
MYLIVIVLGAQCITFRSPTLTLWVLCCAQFILSGGKSHLCTSTKTAYPLLSFQYPINETESLVVCYFYYIHVYHSNIFLTAALNFCVLGMVLVRVCMQRDHYLKYGILFGRARHKSEAVSKAFGVSNNSGNSANDSAGQSPHLLGQSRSTV